jgi:nucleoid DNA-binding protein
MVSAAKKDDARKNQEGKTSIGNATIGALPDATIIRSPSLEGDAQHLSSREIEEYLAEHLGIKKSAAEVAWAGVLSLFQRALIGGRSVRLVEVGALHPYKKSESRYRDPLTGKMKNIPGRKHVKFVLAGSLKKGLRDRNLYAQHSKSWALIFEQRAEAYAAVREKRLAELKIRLSKEREERKLAEEANPNLRVERLRAQREARIAKKALKENEPKETAKTKNRK